jgi:PAS domain S-box-containing protein
MASRPRLQANKPLDKGSAESLANSRIIGAGEMADLIRGFDWTRTSLGPMAAWPDTLVTTVNMLLASRHPMFLWWGPELIQFYNDGYRPSIRADKHPSAVGQRGAECWPEIWSIIGPQIESVMGEGCATWHTNQLVPINRDGKPEEVYWTYSYSPVRDNEGIVRGTLVVCSETTEQVLSERRLKTLLAVSASERSEIQLSQSKSLLPFAQEIVATLGQDSTDIPFAVLYQVSGDDVRGLGAISAAKGPAEALSLALIDLARSQTPVVLENLGERVGSLLCKPWPEAVTRAYVLPLAMPATSLRATLVFGISPRLPFDAGYVTFFQVVGIRIAGLLQGEIQRIELARGAKRFEALVEADPFGMVIGNLQGELSYVNSIFLEMLGYTEEEVSSGKLRWDHLTPAEFAEADARAVEQLRAKGRCDVYEKVYLAKDGRRIPILIGASVIDWAGGEPEVAAFMTDLTPLRMAEEALRRANEGLERKVGERTAALETEVAERKRMEMSLRELSGHLLNTQDQERRRMARELHDNAGQTLSVLAMKLDGIVMACGDKDSRLAAMASEAKKFSDDLSKEIRTLSYLLHPPLLDEVGLESAIRWYVDGFSERSKIRVELILPPRMERLPRDLELVLFRVVQESLTNVHRHSGSESAKIRVTRAPDLVVLEISDRGKGISTERHRGLSGAKTGVGVRGMEERVRQFGGTLQIASSEEGTSVTVNLPIGPDEK